MMVAEGTKPIESVFFFNIFLLGVGVSHLHFKHLIFIINLYSKQSMGYNLSTPLI